MLSVFPSATQRCAPPFKVIAVPLPCIVTSSRNFNLIFLLTVIFVSAKLRTLRVPPSLITSIALAKVLTGCAIEPSPLSSPFAESK